MNKQQSNVEMLAARMDHISENQLTGAPPPDKQQSDDPMQMTAQKILALPGFDYVMGAIIMINLIVMIIDIDMAAKGEETKDQNMHWTAVFGWLVLAIFMLELILRMVALKCLFWHDPWNIIDFVIVATDFTFSLVGLVADSIFPVSILRVFRLSKLARVSKVLRIFPELRMLLVGLVHSLRAVFWGTVLLGLFLLVWSMVAVLVIHPLSEDFDFPDSCERCPRAYSSVLQAALSFWQQTVVGDSWGEVTIPIIEEYPLTALFFFPAYMSIGLSVMNLMLAVVVNLATRAYDNEEETEEAEKALEQVKKHENMLQLCKQLDTDMSGELSREELWDGFKKPGKFHDQVQDLGFTDEDFDMVWGILDLDHSGSVSYKEFVMFLFTMKSSSEHFMMTYIKQYVTWIKNAILRQVEAQNVEEMKLEKKLQESVDAVEAQEGAILKEEIQIEKHLTGIGVGGVLHSEVDIDGSGDPQHKTDSADLDSGKRMPFEHNATQAGREYSIASDAIQDLVRQVSNRVESMHLELKDILMSTKGKADSGPSNQMAFPRAKTAFGTSSKASRYGSLLGQSLMETGSNMQQRHHSR